MGLFGWLAASFRRGSAGKPDPDPRPLVELGEPEWIAAAKQRGQRVVFADWVGLWTVDETGTPFFAERVDLADQFLLGCRALTGTTTAECRPIFLRLFQEYGLPEILRTDNGVPFATQALGRLSQLSVWWIRLGIYPELIEPGHPEQNGRHERMHRTLKRATARPPAASRRSQQQRFEVFRTEYNTVRPHEALGDDSPAAHYTRSPRTLPSQLPSMVYPGHFEQRLVSANGGIRWFHDWVNVSHVLAARQLGSRRWTPASGMYTSGGCVWAASTKRCAESRIPWDG